MIYAIDPGTEQSGWVILDPDAMCIVEHGISDNEWLCTKLLEARMSDDLVIETMQASYGTMGQSTIRTLIWIGEFKRQWHRPRSVALISRQGVKAAICNGNTKATDAGVRQALIDRLGEPGTKKKPGPTYGIKSHGWAALAVAMAHAGSGAG